MNRSFRLGFLGIVLVAAAARLAAHEFTGFSASVLVDGAPVPEYAARGRIYVEAVRGRNFTIRLSNPTGGRVAVALSVDGRNVIDAKRTSEREATKWILGPWQTLEIPGWQISGETARKFFFTETSSSYAKRLGDTGNVGTIEAVFYREKAKPQPRPVHNDERAEPRSQSAPEAVPPATQQEVVVTGEAPLMDQGSSSRAKTADSYAATGIGDRTRFAVEWVDFEEDPSPAARVAIRYEYRPELVRLGVLRADDGLASREHARGFAHDYAPDPDGRD